MHGTKKTRLLRIEARRRPAAAIVVDRSPWDWYAQSCSCGSPPGECRAYSRVPHQPASARRRLASVGLCGRAGRGRRAGRGLGAAPRRDRHHEARLFDRPDHGRHPRRLCRWPSPGCWRSLHQERAEFPPSEPPRFLPIGARAVRLSGEKPDGLRGEHRHPFSRRFRLLAPELKRPETLTCCWKAATC